MRCEAVGTMYGLEPGRRCCAPLGDGVEFDHELAASNGGDNSLENCVAACPICHRFKTTQFDTPRAAKTVRQSDKAKGIVRPSSKLAAPPKQPKTSTKSSLLPRALYAPAQPQERRP